MRVGHQFLFGFLLGAFLGERARGSLTLWIASQDLLSNLPDSASFYHRQPFSFTPEVAFARQVCHVLFSGHLHNSPVPKMPHPRTNLKGNESQILHRHRGTLGALENTSRASITPPFLPTSFYIFPPNLQTFLHIHNTSKHHTWRHSHNIAKARTGIRSLRIGCNNEWYYVSTLFLCPSRSGSSFLSSLIIDFFQQPTQTSSPSLGFPCYHPDILWEVKEEKEGIKLIQERLCPREEKKIRTPNPHFSPSFV